MFHSDDGIRYTEAGLEALLERWRAEEKRKNRFEGEGRKKLVQLSEVEADELDLLELTVEAELDSR